MFPQGLQQPLPSIGAWASDGGSANGSKAAVAVPQGWSPDIIQRKSDKRFVLYYAAADAPRGSHTRPGHCIGAAISNLEDPAGPFTPLQKPLVCDLEKGGAIDPSPFRDKGRAMYLAYKVDGNNAGHGGDCGNTVPPIVPTPIMLQRMLKDGVTPDGPATQILDRTDADGPLVEAPYIVRSKEGVYFLFFSTGCTRQPSYDIRYATADSVYGPYVRASRPLLRSGDWNLEAPGSPSVIKNPYDKGYVISFHSRKQTPQGGVRAMSYAKLWLDGRHAMIVNDVELSRITMHSH